MDMGLFSIQCVLIVEPINFFLQNLPFLVKVVQKIISCEWFSLAV